MTAQMLSRSMLAMFFIIAGISHFLFPASYLAIMPLYLPCPARLVVISGVAEIIGGLGVAWTPTRHWSGWGLIVLLVAVFPANIQALKTGMMLGGHVVPIWILWLRLPLQAVLLFWVYHTCLRRTQCDVP